MKIEFADSIGCPVPQFVVNVENDAERMLLKSFLWFFNNSEWKFHLHGETYSDGKIRSFSFGLVKSADGSEK